MNVPNKSRRNAHRLASSLAALLVAAVVMMAASSAFALDRYASRQGPFFGLGLGGGVGAVDMKQGKGSSGFEDGRLPGLNMSAIVGGGVNDNIVLGAQADLWLRTVQKGSQELSNQHWNFLALGDFYLIKGLYLEGGAGLAYAAFDAQQGTNDPITYREMGFAARVGAGFEYFINGTYAVGINANYTRHFYSSAQFDTATAGISFRWY